jgi:hypothetical protein
MSGTWMKPKCIVMCQNPSASFASSIPSRCRAGTFFSGAMYLNYLTANAGAAGTKAAYGSNYRRLGILKKKYDPDNFFKSNRNIEPLSIVS